MGKRDLLLAWLGAPMARALSPEIDDRIDEALRKRPAADVDTRTAALEERLDQLQKKLAMVSGAVQAATERLGAVRATADEALATARQATQIATTAKATAESIADGEAEPAEGQDGCAVVDCERPHRARGFCAPHYNRWRRGVLEGFVGPDGSVQVGEVAGRVDRVFAGDPMTVDGSVVRVRGRTVGFTPS